MNGFLIFYCIVLWIANIFFSAWLAGMKNRSEALWAVLGAIFPGLAIVAIAGATVAKGMVNLGKEAGYKPPPSMQAYDILNK